MQTQIRVRLIGLCWNVFHIKSSWNEVNCTSRLMLPTHSARIFFSWNYKQNSAEQNCCQPEKQKHFVLWKNWVELTTDNDNYWVWHFVTILSIDSLLRVLVFCSRFPSVTYRLFTDAMFSNLDCLTDKLWPNCKLSWWKQETHPNYGADVSNITHSTDFGMCCHSNMSACAVAKMPLHWPCSADTLFPVPT